MLYGSNAVVSEIAGAPVRATRPVSSKSQSSIELSLGETRTAAVDVDVGASNTRLIPE